MAGLHDGTVDGVRDASVRLDDVRQKRGGMDYEE